MFQIACMHHHCVCCGEEDGKNECVVCAEEGGEWAYGSNETVLHPRQAAFHRL
jgi:hypothetical protein